MIQLIEEKDSVLIPIKVVPNASRTRIMGEWNGRLKVAVASPPEKGRANDALLDFLAKFLGVKRRVLEVVSGTTAATKTVRVNAARAKSIRDALEASNPQKHE